MSGSQSFHVEIERDAALTPLTADDVATMITSSSYLYDSAQLVTVSRLEEIQP